MKIKAGYYNLIEEESFVIIPTLLLGWDKGFNVYFAWMCFAVYISFRKS
jgi:hypothetical protein